MRFVIALILLISSSSFAAKTYHKIKETRQACSIVFNDSATCTALSEQLSASQVYACATLSEHNSLTDQCLEITAQYQIAPKKIISCGEESEKYRIACLK